MTRRWLPWFAVALLMVVGGIVFARAQMLHDRQEAKVTYLRKLSNEWESSHAPLETILRTIGQPTRIEAGPATRILNPGQVGLRTGSTERLTLTYEYRFGILPSLRRDRVVLVLDVEVRDGALQVVRSRVDRSYG